MLLVMRTHAIEKFLLIAWTRSKVFQLAFLKLGNLNIIVRICFHLYFHIYTNPLHICLARNRKLYGFASTFFKKN